MKFNNYVSCDLTKNLSSFLTQQQYHEKNYLSSTTVQLSKTKVKTHHLFPQLSLKLDKCLLMILASTSKPAS